MASERIGSLPPFPVYRLRQDDAGVTGRFEETTIDKLDPGDVVVRVAYSSVNYKDALAATGAGRIVRRFPCVGGIDLAGIVESSEDPRFTPGDAVIAGGYDIGVSHDGGYAQYARLRADWLVPLPSSLTLADAMALGTAGYTAGLAMTLLTRHGLAPQNGPVAVTGATGGVGSFAIDMLARHGYDVVAITSKADQSEYLHQLGARDIVTRDSLDFSRPKPLEAARWGGAVDNLGGDMLAWLLSTMRIGAPVAAIGLAAGMQLHTTVAPFILRGVRLLGVDSNNTPMPLRQEVWGRLASDLRPRHLASIARTIPFEALPSVFDDFLRGQIRGRVVVAM